MAPRWRKAWRDVFDRPGRSLLIVLAMAAGLTEIGAMLYKYAVLQPELTTFYGRTHPASATFFLDAVSDALVDSVRGVPGVAEAEARPVILARARIGSDEWVPAVLYVVRDFDRQSIDTFEPDGGAWPPGDGEILLERTALRVAKVERGDDLTVRTAGENDHALRVAGTVYAAGLAPAWMEHAVPGFVGWNSVARGGESESAQLRIVTDHPLDEGAVHEVADLVQAMLVSRGHVVSRVSVPTPGKHPHADQMAAFLYLLLAFGILSFALSSVLVAGMIHALMAEQVKQVGMMKAIGATSRQIAGIYLAQVSILAGAALCIGIPVGLIVGRAYAQFAAGILNADISHASFPVWVVVLEIAVGFGLPLVVALGPVRRAARITVHVALSGDVASRAVANGAAHPALARLAWLPRPALLSLRATMARPGRLALTVAMLALGGASFMAAINVSQAWVRSVEADFRGRRFDLALGLVEPAPVATVERLVRAVPGVARVESWPGVGPYLVGPNGVAGEPVALFGVPPASRLLDLSVVAGRWLYDDETTGAVVNRAVITKHPALGIGDSVRVRLKGRTIAMPIVGIVKELAPMPAIYAPRAAVIAATGGSAELTRSLRVVTTRHDDASQRAAARGLERAFQGAGIELSGLQRLLDMKQGILDHLVIILSILTMASLVVVFVGGLGLASTLTLNVVQRTREIGILSAIGATPATIARYVWLEAVLIGVFSWGVALALTVPVTYLLEAACGNIFFKAPLDFYLAPEAAGAWLALVIVIASLCSFVPARRAARLTVREALSHA